MKVNRHPADAATHLEWIDSFVNEVTKEFCPCALFPVGRVPNPRLPGSVVAAWPVGGVCAGYERVPWGLGASNCRSAFVAVRWRLRRQDSHVGAVDEGVGCAANLFVVVLSEQVDRALAVKESVLGVQPLADASRC